MYYKRFQCLLLILLFAADFDLDIEDGISQGTFDGDFISIEQELQVEQ